MPSDSPRKHVFIIEDDVATRDALVFILKSEGYRVSSAGDGQEALQRLRGATPPDLILLDLMLPGMNSGELRAELQRDPALAPVPVVVLSAASDLRAKVANLQAADYLEKSAADVIGMQEELRNQAVQMFSAFPYKATAASGEKKAKAPVGELAGKMGDKVKHATARPRKSKQSSS